MKSVGKVGKLEAQSLPILYEAEKVFDSFLSAFSEAGMFSAIDVFGECFAVEDGESDSGKQILVTESERIVVGGFIGVRVDDAVDGGYHALGSGARC